MGMVHGSTVEKFTVEQIEAEISNLHNCEPLNREPCPCLRPKPR